MNFIEAINSGRPFRRPHSKYMVCGKDRVLCYFEDKPENYGYHVKLVCEDYTATDFELMPIAINTTEADVLKAIDKS